MFFDLNVPVPDIGPSGLSQTKKGKGKQPQAQGEPLLHALGQVRAIEARIDLLVHLGYSVIAFNQTVHKKIDPKNHTNILNGLITQLKRRQGVVFLKRLTIILDDDSEKGFGLTNANTSLVDPYDIISLAPTTATTFSLACLTHSLPSPLTAHIISLPLSLPRLPFQLKHTLVRTAIKNGAVFEINYAGAIGGETEASMVQISGGESGVSAKRNWWAAAREVVRVTKGKGLVVSGDVTGEADYRAPRDITNLISLLGLPQNVAHDASTATAKSLIVRCHTRKTYRAVLSEPKLVVPKAAEESYLSSPTPLLTESVLGSHLEPGTKLSQALEQPQTPIISSDIPSLLDPSITKQDGLSQESKKRVRDEDDELGGLHNKQVVGSKGPHENATTGSNENESARRKKKKKKDKMGGTS